jgi:amidase
VNFDEYRAHDATGLAKLVADKEVTAPELLALAQKRAAEVNPQINAIVRDIPVSPSEELSGPFAGVPFLIKDLAQDYAGLPTSNGSRALLSLPWADRLAPVQVVS